MTALVAWVDDRPVPIDEAQVGVLDAGLRLGDGVFTTLRVAGGAPVRLDLHVARLRDDAAASAITAPDVTTLTHAATQVAGINTPILGDHVLRLQLTAGATAPADPFGSPPSGPPRLVVTSTPPPGGTGPLTATVVGDSARRPATVKSTSWAWSAHLTRVARAVGADVALLAEGGLLLEAAWGNVIVGLAGRAVTPRAGGRLLPGTTRGVLLARGVGLVEADVTLGVLDEAQELLVCSAVRGVVPVARVDGRALPVVGGRWHDRLSAALTTAGWPTDWPQGSGG